MAENSAVTSGVSWPEDGAKSLLTALSLFASSARSLVVGDPGVTAWSGEGDWSLWTVWSTGVGVAILGVLQTVCGR